MLHQAIICKATRFPSDLPLSLSTSAEYSRFSGILTRIAKKKEKTG